MIHEMRLNKEPFESIKKGYKTIEMRLNDEKRRLIKVNDCIKFTNRDDGEVIMAKVVNLYYYDSFKELYKHFNKKALGYLDKEKVSYKDMEVYYSKEEKAKYGTVAIEIELIK